MTQRTEYLSKLTKVVHDALWDAWIFEWRHWHENTCYALCTAVLVNLWSRIRSADRVAQHYYNQLVWCIFFKSNCASVFDTHTKSYGSCLADAWIRTVWWLIMISQISYKVLQLCGLPGRSESIRPLDIRTSIWHKLNHQVVPKQWKSEIFTTSAKEKIKKTNRVVVKVSMWPLFPIQGGTRALCSAVVD